MKYSKEHLIKFMRACDFCVDDIDYRCGCEMVGHKMKDYDQMAWMTVDEEGSGFAKLFRGSIKLVCQTQEEEKC